MEANLLVTQIFISKKCKNIFQIGTDTGYFPASSHVSTCHYVLDNSYSYGYSNVTGDHTHL